MLRSKHCRPQGAPLFETIQTRLLHWNYSIITSPCPLVFTEFAHKRNQRNDTTNDSIFHVSDGMQGVYSKMLGVVRILISDVDPDQGQ